jgi:hypothetical protein
MERNNKDINLFCHSRSLSRDDLLSVYWKCISFLIKFTITLIKDSNLLFILLNILTFQNFKVKLPSLFCSLYYEKFKSVPCTVMCSMNQTCQTVKTFVYVITNSNLWQIRDIFNYLLWNETLCFIKKKSWGFVDLVQC